MDLITAILLGIIQGITEFLPISSSGHLEIAKTILGDKSLPKESLLMTLILDEDLIEGTWLFDLNKL